jgi:hypothetical protein
MGKGQDELLAVLNASGFPFQIGVRREIERTKGTHGWKVDAEEYHWRHPRTRAAGFIDLVISHEQYIFTILIECKRVKNEGEWLFLTPRDYTGERKRMSALCTRRKAGQSEPFFGWCDFDFNPVSPESGFCVFDKQEERNPLLERVADDLLTAAEGVSDDYMSMTPLNREFDSEWRLFLPLIVTNASLFAASFDADSVDKANGRLVAGSCDLKPVPMVRFRKSLATVYGTAGLQFGHQGPLYNASLTKERSILGVSAPALAEHLKLIDVAGQGAAFGQKLFGLDQ